MPKQHQDRQRDDLLGKGDKILGIILDDGSKWETHISE